MAADKSHISSPPVLGELEIATLEHVWHSPGATAKETHDAIGRERGVSLNTVQSALDRLYRKQLLDREKISHAFHYRAKVAREKLVAGMINEVLSRFENDRASSLAAFLEAAEQFDEETLLALERELKARRKQGGA